MQTFRRYHHLHTLIQPSLSSPPLSLLSRPSSLKPQSTETCEEGQDEKDEGGGSAKGGMRETYNCCHMYASDLSLLTYDCWGMRETYDSWGMGVTCEWS